MKSDKAHKDYLEALVTPVRKQRQCPLSQEKTLKFIPSSFKENKKAMVNTKKEPSTESKLKKRNTINSTSIEILKIEIPQEDHSLLEQRIQKIESIHQEHITQVKGQFQGRIKDLEAELSAIKNNVLENEEIPANYLEEQQNAQLPLSDSVLELLNSSRSVDKNEQEVHQKVVQELEKQLNKMREEYFKETQNIKDQCQKELDDQKEKYEAHLQEIKQWHQLEKTNLEDRIQRLQDADSSCAGDSYISTTSKEMSVFHLTDQIMSLNNKYSDLKISSSQEIGCLQNKIDNLLEELTKKKEENDTMRERLKKSECKYRDTNETLAIKIKKFERIVKTKDIDSKVVQDLQGQVSSLKRDMSRCEQTEKKLKEAIKKKKEELMREKKLRKAESKVDINMQLRKQELMNKLEKENRKIKAENMKLQEENNKLKNRLSEFIFPKDGDQEAFQTLQNTNNMNNSFQISENKCRSPTPSDKEGFSKRKLSHQSACKADKTFDDRGTSSRQFIGIYENTINNTWVFPKSKYTTQTPNKSPDVFGGKRRFCSPIKTQRNVGSSNKYCETCRDDDSKPKKCSYDPLSLMNNRDIIKNIECFACEKIYDPQHFINHSKNCRLLYGICPVNSKEIICFKNSTCSCENCEISISSSNKDVCTKKNRECSQEADLQPSTDSDLLLPPNPIYPRSSTLNNTCSDPSASLLTAPVQDSSKRVLQSTKPSKQNPSRQISEKARHNLFYDRQSKRHINPHLFLNTINAFDKIEGVLAENKRKMKKEQRRSFLYKSNTSCKSKMISY
ncbi:unnamed protein product [Moneuplotes crassus]|uniref:Uncharacterized protein n=1 Tax=Euplotes crassus TaxID=5936 RepID=A0AAD2D898_EUPCR|nr:unnamed protein product [Moneuplotes crassus]